MILSLPVTVRNITLVNDYSEPSITKPIKEEKK